MTKDTDLSDNAHTAIDQQEVIEEGMQGADGNVDANGLERGADRQEKLEELRENVQGLTTAGQQDEEAGLGRS
ncbi:hypothetical protein [Deinococcus hopiensis]|uniref:Glutamate racemase n=1 Tax=Deinococcus hopiensis KR-140 TaxID=695939 RepID=A0A1W1VSK1_9DEIO|nr:hypothetical protein [Deinococcus hopiensis]SMB95854.1 glutamate racemase [Deinococcus hopiensis KR-140]